MISDTLSDAVHMIDEYLEADQQTWYRGDLLKHIVAVRNDMAALREEIDRASLASVTQKGGTE